jgi:putative endonuclease
MWHVYIIRCRDGTLYTGISTDVERRLAEHQQGGPKAARYLRGRGPLQLMLTLHACDRGTALKLERRIKRLSRAQKEALIQNPETMHKIVGL